MGFLFFFFLPQTETFKNDIKKIEELIENQKILENATNAYAYRTKADREISKARKELGKLQKQMSDLKIQIKELDLIEI